MAHDFGRLALWCAVAAVVGGPAQGQGFKAPTQLSQHGYANAPMVGIDAGGTALAVWADEGAWYSVHAPGKAWTSPQAVYIEGGSGLAMQMTPAGAATIASYQSGTGIYTIDRPPGGAWTAPVTVVSGPDLVAPSRTGAAAMIFVGNASGDQAIVWQQLSGSVQIMAVRRPAGGAWGAPELVAATPAGLDIALADATIGPQGDVLVAWETFVVSCGIHSCGEGNFMVHATRAAAGASAWLDSGPLTPGIETNGYVVRALVDAEGHGGLVMQAGMFPSSLLAARQKAAGATWSPVVTAFADTAGGYPTVAGAAPGLHGQASFVSIDYGAPLRILAADGNLVTDAWRAPTDLSAADATIPGETLAFAANAADGLAVSWVDSDDTVRAALRRKGSVAFAPTQTVVQADRCQMTVVIAPCKAPAAVAINALGQVVTLFMQLDQTATLHTLFATTTN
jgi:hypothetical protein